MKITVLAVSVMEDVEVLEDDENIVAAEVLLDKLKGESLYPGHQVFLTEEFKTFPCSSIKRWISCRLN